MNAKKNVVICGGSYGLGLEITKYFLKKKINVIVLARNKLKLIEIKKIIKNKNLEVYECDLSILQEVENVFSKIKEKKKIVHYLICNAGSGKPEYIINKKYIDYKKAYEQNLFTATNPIEVLINKKNFKNLKILTIASIAGYFKGNAPLPYSLAKNSLINYSKEISKELAKKKITINSISPGHILQKNNNWYKKYILNKKKINNFIHKNVGLKKFCTPNDIINAIEFLISKESEYITGIDLKVDGNTN
jgi:NAD(P)-dependent dehydrogenase (short-subunit alcohol dehydrogenase family)